ncbi:hypothetical protein [Streptomyces coeruleorubidus]|uniref:hypothetical protein n=1 Tax=Streptomyces coeruleorubidus TaxID=116188 RepID=UPI0033AEA72F
MGWLSRLRDERGQRRMAELRQFALRTAAAQQAREQQRQRAQEEERRALCAAITDEVDRRQAAGQLSPLRAAKVLREALVSATRGPDRLDYRYAEVMPAAVRQLVTDVISGSRGTDRIDVSEAPIDPELLPVRTYADEAHRRKALGLARAREKAWAKDHKQREQERARKRESTKQESTKQESTKQNQLRSFDEKARPRRRAEAEEAAPGLLARAGLPPGKNELEIATRLLMRHEEVTPEKVQQAIAGFEAIHEAHVRSFRETGGQTSWPSATSLIEKLF